MTGRRIQRRPVTRILSKELALPVEERLRAAEADRALLRRMAAGDEAALGALYDRYAGLVHALARRIVGDADDAAEVVEDTFWQAWRQADRYRDERGGVATWLTMLGRSRALDRVRARRRGIAAGALEGEVPVEVEDDGAPSPLEQAAAGELGARVRAVLAALPPEQRSTLELAYFSGLSQSEIASLTATPLGTVKTRARLGLARLREALSGLREEER